LYLHNHGIVHRDIKPDNILLGADDVVYLSDFGVSDVFDHTTRSGAGPLKREVFGTRGTTLFFAPELLEAPSSNARSHAAADVSVETLDNDAENQSSASVDGQAVDVWALGMTLYVLLYGRFPWGSSKNMSECFDQIIGAPIAFPNSVPAPSSSDSFAETNGTIELDAAWIDMLRGMLQRDVARRWSIERVRDAARRLADLAESREIEGSPLTSPGLQGLTQITQITGFGREALQQARRGSARFSDTDGSQTPAGPQQHLGPRTPPGPGGIAERAPRDAAHESCDAFAEA
jgi:serine/threonine protein kinase